MKMMAEVLRFRFPTTSFENHSFRQKQRGNACTVASDERLLKTLYRLHYLGGVRCVHGCVIMVLSLQWRR